MPPLPRGKWRPSLAMIVLAVLATVLALPATVFLFLWSSANAGALATPNIFLALGLVLAVTAVIGLVFVRAITGPIRELTDRTARLAAGDRDAVAPLKQHGSREIADLSAGLLTMADALFERTDYIANFATHVSHEIKTPLTSMRGAVELIIDQGDGMTEIERHRFLENILDDTWRITALLERLRELAHADNPQSRGTTTIDAVVQSLAKRYPGVALELSGEADRNIAMTEENAKIVFSNLVENAVQNGATRITMTITQDDGVLAVEICDNGNGVSPGNEARIFDLFFTTRRESGGTGMGLGIVRSMLKAHKGSIVLHGGEPGTCFRLRIPTV